MQTFYFLAEVVATMIESMVALATVTTASGKRWKAQKHVGMLLLVALLISFIVTEMNKIETFSYVTSIASVTLVVLASKLTSTGPALIRCISGIMAFVVIYSVDYIVVALMGIISGKSESFFTDFVLTQGFQRVLFMSIDKAIDILLYFIFRGKLRGFLTISKKLQYPLLTMSVVSFVVMQLLFQVILVPNIPAMQLAIIFSWTFVIGFVTMITAFFLSLSKIERNRQTEEMLRAENIMMTENYRQLHAAQQENARQLHDFKHHIMTMQSLDSAQKKEELSDYIDSLSKAVGKPAVVCHSGNDIIDAILCRKAAQALENHINFKFTANFHIAGKISPIDICGILANQIDNAFDACMLISNTAARQISVNISQREGFAFFRVENTVLNDPFLNNPDLQSTKTDMSSPHGFGLLSIRTLVEKYNGSLHQEYTNGRFISVVSFCFEPFDT